MIEIQLSMIEIQLSMIEIQLSKSKFFMYFTTPVQNLTQKLAYALVPVQNLINESWFGMTNKQSI